MMSIMNARNLLLGLRPLREPVARPEGGEKGGDKVRVLGKRDSDVIVVGVEDAVSAVGFTGNNLFLRVYHILDFQCFNESYSSGSSHRPCCCSHLRSAFDASAASAWKSASRNAEASKPRTSRVFRLS